MFKLGNTFGLRTKKEKEIDMSQSDSAGSPIGAFLTLTRANKAYDTKHAELTDARTKLSELDRVIGEKLADDLDATEDTHERQRLHALVQQLELAVSTLRQRKDEAEASLKAAGQAAKVEAKANALAKNKAVAVRIDEAFEVLRQLAQEHSDTWDAVCVGDDGSYGSYRLDARLQFQLFLNLAAHPFTGRGHAPTAFMKFQKFSECAPSPDLARTRTRP